MIAEIAKKEFTVLIRDGRFRWMAVLMLILLAVSCWSSYHRYQYLHDVQAAAQSTTEDQWVNQGDKNPHTAAHFGNYAFKEPGSLSFFDAGISNYVGTTIWLEAHKTDFAINRPVEDNGSSTRLGELTPAMILQVLVPLIIILLGFSAFAGERDAGTLRQLLSVGIGGRQLLAGKFLGLGAAVALILVPCVLVFVLVGAFGIETESDELGLRGLLLVLFYALYLLIFLLVTLGVSAFAKNGRAALVALVGFWVLVVFFIPKAATDIARINNPTLSFIEFFAKVKETGNTGLKGAEGDVALPRRAHMAKVQKELFERYNVSDVNDLPVYWTSISMQTVEERDYIINNLMMQQLRDTFAAQQQQRDLFGFVSPFLSLRSISMALAGTGLVDQQQFIQSAHDFRINMIRDMNGVLTENTTMRDPLYIAGSETFSIVEPYHYRAPTLKQSMAPVQQSVVLMSVWLAAALLFALRSTRRLQV